MLKIDGKGYKFLLTIPLKPVWWKLFWKSIENTQFSLCKGYLTCVFLEENLTRKEQCCVWNLQIWRYQNKRLVSPFLDESCRRYWVVLTRTPSYSRLFPVDPNGITHPKMLKMEWKGCNFVLTITHKNVGSKLFENLLLKMKRL